MEFGCHLPVYGPAATRHTLLGFARRMEALGYDSLWASDHVILPYTIASRYPYNPTGQFPLPPPAPPPPGPRREDARDARPPGAGPRHPRRGRRLDEGGDRDLRRALPAAR